MATPDAPADETRLVWHPGPYPDGGEDPNADVVSAFDALIRAKERTKVLAALDGWDTVNVMALLCALRFKRAKVLMGWLPDEMHLAAISEIDPRMQVLLQQPETKKRLAKFLTDGGEELRRKLLLSLPKKTAKTLVKKAPEREELEALLRLRQDSAGAVMRDSFIAIPVEWTIGDAKAHIRENSDEIDRIDALYVVDEGFRLLGYLRLRDLLLLAPETPVADVVRADVVSVDTETDQEDVLRLAQRRGLRVVAVCDAKGRLVGAISQSELADIARAEASEDMLIMAGVAADATAEDGPLDIVKRRLPWLMAGLMGSSIAAVVIGSYEDALAQAAILASFIPAVMAMAGNAGIQSSTVTVQAIATETMRAGSLPGRIVREVFGALMNGALVGSIVSILILVAAQFVTIENAHLLALSTTLAMMSVTTLASVVGAIVPLVLKKLGQDPAAATGVFITTSNDVFGVLIYFIIASAIYL